MRNIEAERGLRGRGEALELLLARPESPSRCTLPMTAFRVMPPSSAAIWLAESPSAQSFFKSSTLSSVQPIRFFSLGFKALDRIQPFRQTPHRAPGAVRVRNGLEILREHDMWY